jgi:transposase
MEKTNLSKGTSLKVVRVKDESVDEEIKRLKKELARVTQERDLLKKATAYFAKESL